MVDFGYSKEAPQRQQTSGAMIRKGKFPMNKSIAKHAKPWTPLSRKSDRIHAVRRHAGKHRA